MYNKLLMFQKCVIYLCATKIDLLKEKFAERAIDPNVIALYVQSK